MKPLATLSILAFALSAFAQTTPQTPANQGTTTTPVQIKVKAKGDDIRAVINSIFEQAGKQYVLETNVYQTMYMNLDGVTFEKAIEIVSNVAMIECEEKQGIWYIRPKTVKPAAKPTAAPDEKPFFKPGATIGKGKAPATKGKSKQVKPQSLDECEVAGQMFADFAKNAAMTTVKPTPSPKVPTIDLTGKLTVQLKKMDIREVFGEFGRQTKIEIEIEDTVPNYKLDAYFYNTSLKFALDKVCKIAGLKYSFTPSKTVRISKAKA